MAETPVSSLSEDDAVAAARTLIAARAALHDAVGSGYIIDTAWEVLLALFVADDTVSDVQLAARTRMPRAVARRWFAAFVDDGLAMRIGTDDNIVRLNRQGRRMVLEGVRALRTA